MKDIKYYTILILALLIFIFGSIKGYLVVNPIYFLKPVNYEYTSFFIGSNKLPKTDNYTYLGIPFDKFLSLYWSYGFKYRNSYASLYDITLELRIPTLSAIRAISQLYYFRK
ncbi:hypothetical protein H8356DRAFT_1427950 [Neocallimastix lanati (nom. inval.)]|nr:hypothetical protein H8356DRAFT_1427950 [Neocallimastix sp. JGI-2020a]